MQLRVRKLRLEIRELDNHFEPLATKATGREQEAIMGEWSHEAQWPRSELAQIESARLRRLAHCWNLEVPPNEQDDQTGRRYITDGPRRKLRREIRDARRESIRWWIQVVVLPLIALLSSIVAVISLFFRLK